MLLSLLFFFFYFLFNSCHPFLCQTLSLPLSLLSLLHPLSLFAQSLLPPSPFLPLSTLIPSSLHLLYIQPRNRFTLQCLLFRFHLYSIPNLIHRFYGHRILSQFQTIGIHNVLVGFPFFRPSWIIYFMTKIRVTRPRNQGYDGSFQITMHDTFLGLYAHFFFKLAWVK